MSSAIEVLKQMQGMYGKKTLFYNAIDEALLMMENKHFFVEDDVEARQSLKVDSQKITQLLNELELECDEGIQYFSSLKKRISDKRKLFFEQLHGE